MGADRGVCASVQLAALCGCKNCKKQYIHLHHVTKDKMFA